MRTDYPTSKMYNSCFVVFLMIQSIITHFKDGLCELSVTPQNKAVRAREIVNLNCSSDEGHHLRWLKWSDGGEKRLLFNGYYLQPDSDIRSFYNASKGFPGSYHLQVTATNDTAGIYICEEPGTLTEASAQLIVFDNDPKCSAFENEDSITLACNMQYFGGWPPEFIWTQSDYSQETTLTGKSITVDENGTVTNTLTVYRPRNDTNYTCTIRFKDSSRPLLVTATNEPDYKHVWKYQYTQDEKKSDTDVPMLAILVTLAVLLLVTVGIVAGLVYHKTHPRLRSAMERKISLNIPELSCHDVLLRKGDDDEKIPSTNGNSIRPHK